MFPHALGLVPLRRTPHRRRRGVSDVTTRSAALLPRVLIALLVPLVGFTWVANERAVSVVLDGQVTTVRTHADTVSELLARSDIAVGPHDRVEPALDTPLADGMVVEVVQARQLTVLLGDEERTVWVSALTVDGVLQELGEGLGPRDIVRPSRLARVEPGMIVRVSRPVSLLVVHDGIEHEVITDAGTVRQLLERLRIDLDPDDRVTPELDAVPDPGGTVVIQRVARSTETRRVDIPFDTIERETTALPRGQRREVRAGRNGVKEIEESIVRVDGEIQEREVISERVIAEPRDRIVEVGTGAGAQPAPQERSPASATVGQAPKFQEGKASWYDHPGSDPLTAAHRTLPFGTRVTVTNLDNGKKVQVRINDRGPFVEGRIIDLNRPAFREISSPRTGILRVRIEW